VTLSLILYEYSIYSELCDLIASQKLCSGGVRYWCVRILLFLFAVSFCYMYVCPVSREEVFVIYYSRFDYLNCTTLSLNIVRHSLGCIHRYCPKLRSGYFIHLKYISIAHPK